jgi:hypothetical protein
MRWSCNTASQSVACGGSALSLPGSFLELQNLWPTSESLDEHLHFRKIPVMHMHVKDGETLPQKTHTTHTHTHTHTNTKTKLVNSSPLNVHKSIKMLDGFSPQGLPLGLSPKYFKEQTLCDFSQASP